VNKEVNLPFYFQSLQNSSCKTTQLAPALFLLLVRCAVIARN